MRSFKAPLHLWRHLSPCLSSFLGVTADVKAAGLRMSVCVCELVCVCVCVYVSVENSKNVQSLYTIDL